MGYFIIWTVTGLLAGGAIACISRALKLHFRGRADIVKKELEKRKDDLNQQRKELIRKVHELDNKRSQITQGGEVDDLEWRIDDANWWLQDLDWAIRDTKWEIDDRVHRERTSRATFWAVLGAALLASASLVLSAGKILIG